MSEFHGATTALTFNSGSSSLKFGLYRFEKSEPVALISGEIETIGEGYCRIRANDAAGDTLIDEKLPMRSPSDGVSRLGALFDRAKASAPTAIGHRIVHGGPSLRTHCLIDDAVLQTLDAAVCFAPLHVPPALAVIRYAREHFPGLPQVACFDTAFHATMPEVATTLPLPHELRARGIQRYGFHGLSCESIVRQLGRNFADKLVIAHLGNGASVTAVKAGHSIDTSMGLTPAGGVIMGTRTGDIDPGILLYLMRGEHLDADDLEDLINRRSGLAGISGVSSDVRKLNAVEATEPKARLALDMFRISVAKQIAGMIVALGGIDTLVFTGGIGEHDGGARAGIVERLSWCGIHLDGDHNGEGCNSHSDVNGRTTVLVLTSREDDEIARQTRLLARAD
ncbi:acetate/propionate family kinase (plasmid) [Sphingomonas paeninsulae]|uniref:Acetate kinase n=1 Tax=Sphingomonas paeninsulae TaxID=2319844 RepID=A0A494THA0_SPHPE|nr:acetate/propionate family kinase [Sphingomonas paeninsulae]AYJ84565.1 acetate/propionate family kinase [Sphingomonas paeninsulae]